MRNFLLAAALCLATPALAGPVDDSRLLYIDGRFAEALAVLRPAAEAGDANAQNILGDAYDDGNGVGQDTAKALDWWQKSAAQGFPKAIFNLALLYQKGRPGIPADLDRAKELFLRAMALDYAEAFNNLGHLHQSGAFGAPDHDRAAELYALGAERGSAQAANNLGIMLIEGIGRPVDADAAMARFRAAAQMGNAGALNNLGAMYENGYGTGRDLTAAFAIYAEALRNGNARAAHNMAWLMTDTDSEGYWTDRVRGLAYFLYAMRIGDDAERADFVDDCEAMARSLAPEDVEDAEALAAEL